MKRLLIALIAIVFSLESYSQYYKDQKFILGGSLGYAYPIGNFGDQAKAGLAFHLGGQMMLNKQILIGAELGYTHLGQDDFWIGNQSVTHNVDYNIASAILKGGFIFNAWDRDFKPYASIGFGYFLYHFEDNFISSSGGSVSQKRKVTENKVGLVPNVGFMYYLSDNWAFDMNLRYTFIPNFPDSITEQSENGENYQYYLGFNKISLPELSIGFYYRF
ncbi:MAG: outer membrane beta-barrel protein [Marinifilum sp.]|jgi:outer membrane protein W|nr:outer membrane beta-barrel protein [Marinifilum sp.]